MQLGRRLDRTRQLFADDRAHASHDEGRIGDAEDERPTAEITATDDTRFPHAGAGLFLFQSFRIGPLVDKAERILRGEIVEPLFEAVGIEQQADAFLRRDVEMMAALGTAFTVFFDPLAIDGLLAAVAADPQPFGNTPFSTRRHGGSQFGFDLGFFDGAHSGALRGAVVGISAESPVPPPGIFASLRLLASPLLPAPPSSPFALVSRLDEPLFAL